MEQEQLPQYESLSEDEADIKENENETENSGPPTEGSVQAEKGVKRKWSKAWDTFKFIDDAKTKVRCIKCDYSLGYNSSFGTGNMLKHQKNCSSSSDIRQMMISKSKGSMTMHDGTFDPKIFRDMITDAVIYLDGKKMEKEIVKVGKGIAIAEEKSSLLFI